jgi:hypothetical protein
MAKDPATLFYWNDWHGGTVTLSRFLKGCYMDLLYAQFNCGHLSLDEIKTVLGSDFGSAWPALQKKFKVDDNGLFFNERLVFESVKRQNYTSSRRKNANSEKHMLKHMENENENDIVNNNDNKGSRIEFFKNSVNKLLFTEDVGLVDEFVAYWTESSPNGRKMRFEKQETFDIGRRFATWKKNDKNWNKTPVNKTESLIDAYNKVKEHDAINNH